MQTSTAISERRACTLISLSRSVLHYVPRVQPANEVLQARLIELAQERRRFGYRRLHVLLRREGVIPPFLAVIRSEKVKPPGLASVSG